MANLSDAFVVQYQSEFTHLFQTQGSLLRNCVFTKNGVVGNSTKFPLLDKAITVKNRPRSTPLVGDQDKPHSTATVNLNRYESWREIDSLEEFETNIDVRRAYSESVVMELGRDIDTEILGAAAGTTVNNSTSASMNLALVAKINAKTKGLKWFSNAKKTWVISPSVWAALMQEDKFASSFYNKGMPLTDGEPVNFGGFNWVVHPDLDTATYWNSASDVNTFVINERSLALAIGRDITPVIERRPDLNAMQVLCEGLFGAGRLQDSGVIKVGVTVS